LETFLSDQLGAHVCTGYVDCHKLIVSPTFVKRQSTICSEWSATLRANRKEVPFSIRILNGKKAFGYKVELICSGWVLLVINKKGKWGGCGNFLGRSKLCARERCGTRNSKGEHWSDETVEQIR